MTSGPAGKNSPGLPFVPRLNSRTRPVLPVNLGLPVEEQGLHLSEAERERQHDRFDQVRQPCLDDALKHHASVLVIIEIGNHDLASSVFPMKWLANLYANEPRVEVDTAPGQHHGSRQAVSNSTDNPLICVWPAKTPLPGRAGNYYAVEGYGEFQALRG